MRRFGNSGVLCALIVVASAMATSVRGQTTIGYWQFETAPGFTNDSAGTRNLTATTSSPSQVTSPFGQVTNPPAGSVTNAKAADFLLASSQAFTATDPAAYSDLTVEAFINLRSVDTSGATARVIASQFNSSSNRAFNFGIAGNGSTTFPADRTLFLQLTKDGSTLINLDSTFRLTLNNNYYLAASIDSGAANAGADGTVTFYLKDLTAGGAMQTAVVTAPGLSTIFDSSMAIGIGSSNGGTSSFFDGTIDEVRLTSGALTANQLLVPEPASIGTLGIGLILAVLRRRPRRKCECA